MNKNIMDDIEKRISEQSKIIENYKLLHEKMINLSVLYETSLRKIPILIETAEISNCMQKASEGTSYGVLTYEAYDISKAEVNHQINKVFGLCNESDLILLKINELINELSRNDREFLTNLQRVGGRVSGA